MKTTDWFIHYGSEGPEIHANSEDGDSPIADIPSDCIEDPEEVARLLVKAPKMYNLIDSLDTAHRLGQIDLDGFVFEIKKIL
jgi:hypothetical protein